jgi:hypothetical protein
MRRALLFVMLAACSSSSAPAGPSPTPSNGPPDAGCPAGLHAQEGACVTRLTVQRSPVEISPVRDHHTTHVIETSSGPYLYVLAGTDAWNTIHDDVQRAAIKEDGSITAFEPAGKMPYTVAGHCTVRQNGRLIATGGLTSKRTGVTAKTISAPIDGAGVIGAWSDGPEMPMPVMHHTCEVAKGYLFVFGGRGSSGSSTNLAARARIKDDGTLDPFEKLAPLSPERSHHAGFVRGDRVYLVGGLTGNPVGNQAKDRKDVVFAALSADGTLGPFEPAGELPGNLSISAAQPYGDAIYLFGGYPGGSAYSNEIRRIILTPDGTVAEATAIEAKLPSARGHVHQTPTWKNRIYSVGGHDDLDTSIGFVDIGTFE